MPSGHQNGIMSEPITRPNPYKTSPAGVATLNALNAYVNGVALEKPLVEIARLRASQLNRCAYCIGLHTDGALKAGVAADKLILLPAWQLADAFTDREKAVLAWTEAVSLVADTQVSDELYASVSEHLSESELVDLSYALVEINAWNRLQVAFRL